MSDFREPRESVPRAWGPLRQTWPDKVAVVSYGLHQPYIGPVNLQDFTGVGMVSVGGPVDLGRRASLHNV